MRGDYKYIDEEKPYVEALKELMKKMGINISL